MSGLVQRQIGWVAEPTRGFLEAAPEAVEAAILRLPAQEGACLLIRREEPFHFTLFRAQSLLVRDDLDLSAHDFRDRVGGVADRDLEIAAQVDDLAHGPIRIERRHEASSGVSHPREVARGMQRAEA